MYRRWFLARAGRLSAAMPFALALAPAGAAEPDDAEPDADAEIDVTPAALLVVIGRRAVEMLRWSPAQWDALDDERPAGVGEDSDGHRIVFRAIAADDAFEEWSPDPLAAAELELRLAREAMESGRRVLDELLDADDAPAGLGDTLAATFVHRRRKRVAAALRRCRRLSGGPVG